MPLFRTKNKLDINLAKINNRLLEPVEPEEANARHVSHSIRRPTSKKMRRRSLPPNPSASNRSKNSLVRRSSGSRFIAVPQKTQPHPRHSKSKSRSTCIIQ